MRREYLKTAVLIAATTIFAATAWYLYYKYYFTGLVLNDAMDYAGIARNVARGQGFISQYLTPLSLAHHGVPQPDMWRAPLWPLALAGFQRIFGFIDEASALGSGFFFVMTAPLVFLLARQWFGATVGLFSALACSASPVLLYYSISGMTESMGVFLMVLTFLAFTASPLKNKPGDIISGVSLGLFYLARYNALLFLPFFLAYRWHSRKKGLLPPALTLAGFTLTILPWLVRNSVIFGNPFFSLQKYEPVMFTKVYPDYSLYLFPIKVDVIDFIVSNTSVMWDKIAASWQDWLSMAFSPQVNGVSYVIFALFLLSLFIPMNKKTSGIRPLIASCFLAQLAALIVIHLIPRLFLIFAPLYIIFAFGAMASLFGKIRPARHRTVLAMVIASLFLLLSFHNFAGTQPPERENSFRRNYARQIHELSRTVPPGQVVLTNEGHLVSWYGDVYACKIPYSPDMIPEIQKRAPVAALFISNHIMWHMPEADRKWKEYWYKDQNYIRYF